MTYDVPLLVITDVTESPLVLLKDDLQALDQVSFFCSADTVSNTKEDQFNDIQYSISCSVVPGTEPYLLPYTTVMVWRKLSTAICINNILVTRYQAPKVTEYLDQSTGEIIQASDLRDDPRVPLQIHFGEIQLLRQALIASLRREVRAFALFVLLFRNNRRGLTPEIDTLVEWYANLHGKRPSNVRRYVVALEKVGFLAGSSLLSRLFQRTGRQATARDHLGEDAAASRIYFAQRFNAGLGAPRYTQVGSQRLTA